MPRFCFNWSLIGSTFIDAPNLAAAQAEWDKVKTTAEIFASAATVDYEYDNVMVETAHGIFEEVFDEEEDRDDDETIKKQVRDLVIGDLVDLEGDPIADPNGDNQQLFSFEYLKVVEINHETPDCIVVVFDSISVGFPPDHVVSVYAEK